MKATQIIERINNARKDLEFLPVGIPEVDTQLDGGFIREELIVIGGFTGIGKSYLSSQILYNIATKGYKTAYFSLEITNQMVLSRLIGQQADVKSIKVVTGNMQEFEHKRAIEAEGKLQGYEEYMDFYDDVYEFENIVKLIKENNYEFVVIDFIQNIIVKGMDEYERLSYVSLMLQKIAKEKKCCILVLSQLSNSIARNINEAQLEYKGSGAIATVCDLGFFLIRETDRDLGIDKLTLLLKKNRRGASGQRWELSFRGEGGLIV